MSTEAKVRVKKSTGEMLDFPIQAVHFSRDRFKSAEEAARWLDANGLSARAGAHHFADSWSFEQLPKDRFASNALFTVPGGDGVELVVGRLVDDPLEPEDVTPSASVSEIDARIGLLARDRAPLPAVAPRAPEAARARYAVGDRIVQSMTGMTGIVRSVAVEPTYSIEFDVLAGQRRTLGEAEIELEPNLVHAYEVAKIEKAGGGLMIALCLEPDDAAGLAVEGGLPPEELHVTLAYCGKIANLPADAYDRVAAALEGVTQTFGPIVGVVGGIGMFNASATSDGLDVMHASFDSPVLPALRDAIVKAIDDCGVPVKKEHGFDPHITLKYVTKSDDDAHMIPKIPTRPLVFKSLGIRAGKLGPRVDLPFRGHRISKSVADNEGGEGKGTSAAWWADAWASMLPRKGHGSFVYQRHWTELEEKETKYPETELAKTLRPVHGDLRFEGSGTGLWGFALPLGKSTNFELDRAADPVTVMPVGESMAGSWKSEQSVRWLDVGVCEPGTVEPGKDGAKGDSYARFFAGDFGTFRLGVCSDHQFEIFFAGLFLEGRYLIRFAQNGARRDWVLERPESQMPTAIVEDVEDFAADLKTKGQKFLYWNDPFSEDSPVLIELARWEPAPKIAIGKTTEKGKLVSVTKMDADKQIVYGVVLEPDYFDSENDMMTAEEIEKAAHGFMEKWRTIGELHTSVAAAVPVESFIAPSDIRLGSTKVKKGSWILGVKIKDRELWKKIKSGVYRAFSVGGYGRRRKAGVSKRI